MNLKHSRTTERNQGPWKQGELPSPVSHSRTFGHSMYFSSTRIPQLRREEGWTGDFPAFVPAGYPGTWNKTLLRCLVANSKAHHSFHKHFHISGNITCKTLVAGYVACGSQNVVRLKNCWAAQQTVEQEREFPWYNHFFLKCEVAFKLSIASKTLSGFDCSVEWPR